MKNAILVIALTSVFSACAQIPMPVDQVNEVYIHWIPPKAIDAICPGYNACAIGSDVYIPGDPAERTFKLTWVFTSGFVSMSGNTITGAAWPEEWRLCELLIENLDLPEMTWRECHLTAHEVMHVFGMWHPQPEHRGSAP